MKAYILIEIRPGEVHEVMTQLRRTGGILEAYMTFGPYDAVAVAEAADVNRIGHIIASEILPIPGVIKTMTCLALED